VKGGVGECERTVEGDGHKSWVSTERRKREDGTLPISPVSAPHEFHRVPSRVLVRVCVRSGRRKAGCGDVVEAKAAHARSKDPAANRRQRPARATREERRGGSSNEFQRGVKDPFESPVCSGVG